MNVSLSKNWEHLQNKFVGTGHPDLTRQCVTARSSCAPACARVPRMRAPAPTPAPRRPPCPARSEWAVNHHRDSIASHIGHTDLLTYFAVAEGASVGRTRYAMLERMIQPCGPPPAAKPTQ